MLHKISSLDEIKDGIILYDSPDEYKANQFSILDISENFIRVIQTQSNSLLKIFLVTQLLSDDWWISGNSTVMH